MIPEPMHEKWDEAVAADEEAAAAAAAAAAAVAAAAATATATAAAEHSDEPAVPATFQPRLAVHAKVYELSKKYGIEGLETLSLGKFQSEAGDHWDTEDFLQAAKEVYSTETNDRRMKDMVTEIVCHHTELLDREETQTAIRGLDLSYDVLMRMRKQGGL